MTTAAIRNRLYDFIRIADDKKLHAIYNLLEHDIEKEEKWWQNSHIIAELDKRADALLTGEDSGFTTEQLAASIDKLRAKKYGK